MIPTAENKFYLTKEGLKNLKQEFGKLLEFKKAKTKGEIPRTWHSEEVNPEYLTFQEDLNLLEAKLVEYEAILKNVELIKVPPKAQRDMVHLGATVIVDVDGQKDEFTIVGSLETDPTAGKISNESVVGRALLGARKGDTIVVSSSVRIAYKIKKIHYSLIGR